MLPQRPQFGISPDSGAPIFWRMIFPENRYAPRIKCGAGFFRIMRYAGTGADCGSALLSTLGNGLNVSAIAKAPSPKAQEPI